MNKVVQELITDFLKEHPKSNKDYIRHEINGHIIVIRLEHYVEEDWMELSFEEGIQKKKHSFPVRDKETYQPPVWVSAYYHYDLIKISIDGKTVVDSLFPINVTQIHNNPNYNPLYFLDPVDNNVELISYVQELWTEYNDKEKKIKERQITFPIKNRKDYKPAEWVKEYSFFDTVKITNKNGKVIILTDEQLNISPTYQNEKHDPLYYLDEETKRILNSPMILIPKKRNKTPKKSAAYIYPKKIAAAGK